MTRKEKVQYWLDIVAEDLDLLQAKHSKDPRHNKNPKDSEKNKTNAAMDTPKVLTRNEALQLVREYKRVISPRFNGQMKVMMFGSYSKGNPSPWSDIDVAIVVPKVPDDEWLDTSIALGLDSNKVSLLIEPVLMSEDHWSPLYDDVMQTGIAV